VGKVNNTMYVNDTGISKQLHTVIVERYKNWLDTQVPHGTTLEEVKPYGDGVQKFEMQFHAV
jgi:hypothetical protein